jgi:NAD(P)-dependent dehydrogenase (short-subunit alcohol dehydrogenase family)
LAAARELARAGARVVLAVRDPEKGQRVAAGIPGDTEVRPLDLASLASVRAFAAGWTGALDILVNNAGIMAVPEGRTVDGFELQIGTNHLGPFLLTGLLVPAITDRVVTVSSQLHRRGRIDLEDLNWEHRGYNATGAYNASKLANVLFTVELQRRLTEAGSRVRAVTPIPVSPGPAWGTRRTGSPGRSTGISGGCSTTPGTVPCRRCTRPPRTYREGPTSGRTAWVTFAATPRSSSRPRAPGTPRWPAGCGTCQPGLPAPGRRPSPIST